ncbi:unnamed protein product [Symbiodinium sp. CCMP2592]|nr:unnamed protein product [Symbiodinium sp. CCMP2592]
MADPRVESHPTLGSGVLPTAGTTKTSGGTANCSTMHTRARKRAFRRARHRAATQGGTFYRGKWHTASDLGVTERRDKEQPSPVRPNRGALPWTSSPRLKVRSYNAGGITAESYDRLCHWLTTSCQEDIVILQEIHWGCGREDGTWSLPGWNFFVSADPAQRYSGVCVIISQRLGAATKASFCTWIPGRLLQVRLCTDRATMDIVAGYQWTGPHDPAVQEKRSFYWSQLSRLLHAIPTRNMVVLGADFNTRCAPIPGHVGRGVLRCSQGRDAELDALIIEHNLVLLNTWCSARASCSHTFVHGEVRSQIDYIALRRPAADAAARRVVPHVFDLAPWRRGPKHHALIASIPWRAGWTYQRPPQVSCRFAVRDLRMSVRMMDARAHQLQSEVSKILSAAGPYDTLAQINANILAECKRLYPRSQAAPKALKPYQQPEVRSALEAVESTHQALKTGVTARGIRNSVLAWKRAEAFKQASRRLRQVSRAARRAWFETKITEAEHAATRHDLSAVYRIVNLLAPKRRRDPVRIRGMQGELLSPQAEFDAIFEYFQGAFSSAQNYQLQDQQVMHFDKEELMHAIAQLRGGKAVPSDSAPAEVWRLCPAEFAQFLLPRVNLSTTKAPQYPPEVADCTLFLLPKPNKPGRRPADLRPLGIQDPSSKVTASAIRNRLQELTLGFLQRRPQYAYCPDKAIDQAIARVCQHCRQVRDRVQHAIPTVHGRREGQKSSQCVGGIMLGLDLSRAFDCIPRAALQRALLHAGASEPLVQAVTALHSQCRYKVQHKGISNTFDMELGVRQGCTLSPYLFSLFTCLVYDVLVERTNEQWAKAAITLFADDTHLAWDVYTGNDLRFFMHCTRVTFQVFEEFGMTVNPAKSQLVLKLRGSAAARWFRSNRCLGPQGPTLNVGLPHAPLQIPIVPHMKYLGIIASYSNFELQTCYHRQQAALGNRHRLARVLQHRQLTLQQRVRLYVACVRSSLLYGQHATGFTSSVLRRHDQFDARVLRAIAHAPAHLYKESTADLRIRLKVESPSTVLAQTLEGRIRKTADAESVQWFSRLQQDLISLRAQPATGPATESSPFGREPQIGVACPECGQYFSTVQTMRTHQAKRHGYKGQNARPQPGVLDAVSYAACTVDGMPQCISCKRKFTRVEALKKHIKSGCPAKAPVVNVSDVSATADAEQVPASRAESPRGWALQADTSAETARVVPILSTGHRGLLADPDFCAQVQQNWRQTLRLPHVCGVLREYCLVCGQWGNRLKQHIRRMHPEFWALRPAAELQCKRLGLLAVDPCHYCGLHANLEVMSEPMEEEELAQQRRKELEDVWGGRSWEKDRSKKTRERSPDGEEENTTQEREPKPKWPKEANKGKGPSRGSWDAWSHNSGKRNWQSSQSNRDHSSQDDGPMNELVKCLVKMSVRHEQELTRLRPDVGFIAFCDTSELGCLPMLKGVTENWIELQSKGQVKQGLKNILAISMMKDLRERAELTLREEDRLQKCKESGWLIPSENSLNPAWVYHTWDAQTKQQVVSEAPPLKHCEALRLLDMLIDNLGMEGVLTKFASAKQGHMQDKHDKEVIPMMMNLSLRGAASDQCHDAMKKLSGCALVKLQGVRWRPERAHKAPLANALEEAYLQMSFCDWSRRDSQVLEAPVCVQGTAHTWCLGRHHSTRMHRIVALPEHVCAVAQEEIQLLCALRDLIPSTEGVRPSITMATCNEIAQEAQLTLPPNARAKFFAYVERMSQHQVHHGLTRLPNPVKLRPRNDAEVIAQAFLEEGTGSLWSAAREVARALSFDHDPREAANGRTLRLGLYSKGGITGLAKPSGHHLAVSRIFNALIREILPQHCWTSLSVNLNNHTAPHYDAHNATDASLLVGLSHHDAGQLWIQDNAGDVVLEAEGTRYWGMRYPTAGRAVLFDSRRLLHGTMPWMGDRYILIAYTVGSRATTKVEHIEFLKSAGYQLPDNWDAWRPMEGKGQTKLGQYFGDRSDAKLEAPASHRCGDAAGTIAAVPTANDAATVFPE